MRRTWWTTFLFPAVITLIAFWGIWHTTPMIRRALRVPVFPIGPYLVFSLLYVIWTGLRGLRYWLLLQRPRSRVLDVIAIAFVHHAAIDYFPVRSGVLAYPTLVRNGLHLRWRRILESMTLSAGGDVGATAVLWTLVVPGAGRWAAAAFLAAIAVLAVVLRRRGRAWFRQRHRWSRKRFRWRWRAMQAGALALRSRPQWEWLAWGGISLVIVGLKYLGLSQLYAGWSRVYYGPELPWHLWFLATVAAEASRELPIHGLVHMGSWEWVWLQVSGAAADMSVVLWTHITYELAVTQSAVPGILWLLLRGLTVRNPYRRRPKG